MTDEQIKDIFIHQWGELGVTFNHNGKRYWIPLHEAEEAIEHAGDTREVAVTILCAAEL